MYIIDNARCVFILGRLPAIQDIVPLIISHCTPPTLDMVAPIIEGDIVMIVRRSVAGMVASPPTKVASEAPLVVDKTAPAFGKVARRESHFFGSH